MVELAPATASTRPDAPGEEADGGIVVDRRNSHAAVCRWNIPNFSKLKQRTLWSKYFDVGGYDCRLLVYPSGDSQALPGYVSIYLQVTDPRGSSGKWDCFASYRLCVVNAIDDAKSVPRDSWHRFSAKKKSHGWCDFIPAATVLDSKAGFAINDTIIVTAEILVLRESVAFTREADPLTPAVGGLGVGGGGAVGDVFSGKFTWRVHNFSLFRETVKTQKVMSPVFPAGECALRLSVYQSPVNGVDHLSMCLESKDTDKVAGVPMGGTTGAGPAAAERSCWCLFRMTVACQTPGGRSVHRDSYGRFGADARSGDNTSLGWNDYMPMAEFADSAAGYVVDDTAVFSTTFHIIRESCSFSRLLDKGVAGGSRGGRPSKGKPAAAGEPYQGKFSWRIENFTKLKELLKKRKITGLCIKSKRFQVGGRDCRLIVYPRGQSQPPCHLSMFLEVTDTRPSAADWSCFVSHRLAVVNQRDEARSVTKESQNRYSKAAKDWGWREFVTLTSLFDQDAGFLVNDSVLFSAEVLLLKESSDARELPAEPSSSSPLSLAALSTPGPPAGPPPGPPPCAAVAANGGMPVPAKRVHFTWRIENFCAFKEIMETRKIFSRYFSAGGCELRIGVYESFDTLCIYLESSDSFGEGGERNFWVKYKIAVLNQRAPEATEWKESAICTKTWNNSVLQFMKVSGMTDPEAGYVVKDTLVLACEVLECCPWFEFADLDVYASDEGDGLSTDADELLDSDDGHPGQAPAEEDVVRALLARAGLPPAAAADAAAGGMCGPLGLLGDAVSLQGALRDKLLHDPAAAAAFLTGLRLSLDDPGKMKRLLLPSSCTLNGEAQCVSLMNLLMGIRVLQPAIVDMVLDIMVACCRAYRRDPGATTAQACGTGAHASVEAAAHAGDVGNSAAAATPASSRSSTPLDPSPLPTSRGYADAAGSSTDALPQQLAASTASTATAGAAYLQQPLPGSPPAAAAMAGATGGAGYECGAESDGGSTGAAPAPALRCNGRVRPDSRCSTAASQISDSSGDCSSSCSAGGAQAAQHGLAGGSTAQSAAAAGDWAAQSGELLGLIVGWLGSLEGPLVAPARSDGGSTHPLPTVHKVATLLSDAPQQLQPDIVMLVPKLVDASEHTAVAGALLGRLAEASREGPGAEAALRLPTLAALGRLAIDPAVADKVLHAALEALPYLSEAELPPAVGLVLKLASESAATRPAAVRAVRERVRSAAGGCSSGTLDALRLALAQHPAVAAAMLVDIDADRQAAKPAGAAAPGAAGGEASEPSPGAVADVEMLLDLLGQPGLAAEAERVAERLVARGAAGHAEFDAVLERRRMQALVHGAPAGQSATGDAHAGCGAPANGGSGGAAALLAADDFDRLLGLAAGLAGSPSPRVRAFLPPLYSTLFRLYADEGSRERVLRGLVGQAACSGSAGPSPAPAPRPSPSPAPPPGGKGGGKRKAPAAAPELDRAAGAGANGGVGGDGQLAPASALLLGVVREYSSYAPATVAMMVEAAQRRTLEVEALQRQLVDADAAKAAAVKAEAARAVAAEARVAAAEAATAALQRQLDARADEAKADAAAAAAERRRQAEQLAQLEQQVEWLRGERDEEAGARAKERKELSGRLREAETQVQRLKAAKRDDTKRAAKERAALLEAVREAEATAARAEQQSARAGKALAARRDAAAAAEAKASEALAAQKAAEAQVKQFEGYVASLEAQLRTAVAHAAQLQAGVGPGGLTQLGVAPDALAPGDLDAAARLHEQALKRVRELQAQRARGREGSAPLSGPTTSLPLAQAGLGFGLGAAAGSGPLPPGRTSVSSLSHLNSGLTTALSGSGSLGLGGLGGSHFYGANGSAFVTHPPAPQPGEGGVQAGGKPGLGGVLGSGAAAGSAAFGANPLLGSGSVLSRQHNAGDRTGTHRMW